MLLISPNASQVEKERETIGTEAQQAKASLQEAEAALATHKAEAKRLAEMLQGADQVKGTLTPAASALVVSMRPQHA